MKKFSWIIAFFAIFVMVFTSFMGCKDGGSSGDVDITFFVGEGAFNDDAFATQKKVTVKKGGTVTAPAVSRTDHGLVEWNTKEDGTGTPLAPSTKHNSNTDYYAIWEDTTFEVTESWDFSGEAAEIMSDDNNASYWTIEGEIITKLRAAEEGSVLRLHFDASDTTNGTNRNNWAIGSIGTATSATDANVIGLWSPASATLIYHVDVELEWCLDLLGDSGTKLMVFVPKNNGDKLMKIELLEPMEGRVAPERPAAPAFPPNNLRGLDADGNADGFIGVLPITFGYFGDIATGKGEIAGAEIDLINEEISKLQADDDSSVVLRIWTRNIVGNDRTSWADCGQINSVPGLIGGADGRNGVDAPENNRKSDIKHDGPNGITALLGNRGRLDLNPYNGQIITLVELWVITPPSMNVILRDTVTNTDTSQKVMISAVGGSAKTITGGFEFDRTANHRSGFSFFEVHFGTKRLSGYSEIKFDYVVTQRADTSDRRVALLASTTAFTGLSSHSTGGSGEAFPNGSDNGYLAAGQVSDPILNSDKTEAPAITDPETKQTITLKINATEAVKYNTERVFLSIYDHNNASVIQITNVVFVEAVGCTLCPEGACECDSLITAAKTAVDGMTFTGGKVNNSLNENNAIAYVEGLVKTAVNNATVVVTIETVSFTPWTAGGNGSFVFKVKLDRGAGTEQVTSDKTLAIGAFEVETVWTLASYLNRDAVKNSTVIYTVGGSDGASNSLASAYAGYASYKRITSNDNLAPIRTSSGTPNTHLLVYDANSLYSIGSGSNNWSIQIGTAGLALKTKDFVYEIRVTGESLDDRTSFGIQYGDGVTVVTGSASFVANVNRGLTTFEIGTVASPVYLPQTTANPEAAVVRFNFSSPAHHFRIDSIEIIMTGVQPAD